MGKSKKELAWNQQRCKGVHSRNLFRHLMVGNFSNLSAEFVHFRPTSGQIYPRTRNSYQKREILHEVSWWRYCHKTTAST